MNRRPLRRDRSFRLQFSLRTMLAAVLVLGSAGCAQTSSSGPSVTYTGKPRLIMDAPRSGDTFMTNKGNVDIRAHMEPPLEVEKPVHATVTVGSQVLASGDLRAGMRGDTIQATWDVEGAPAGPHTITIDMDYAGKKYVAEVDVVLTSPPDKPTLFIDNPRSGANLFTDTEILVLGHIEPFEGFRKPINATIKAGSLPVASGDLREDMTGSGIEAVWTLADVPPGPYALQVEVKYAGKSYSAVVDVTVHHPPRVSMAVDSVQQRRDGRQVVLVAQASSPSGTPIAQYRWTLGDGTPMVVTSEPKIEHRYDNSYSEVAITLVVEDKLGGSSVLSDSLKLPAGKLQYGGRGSNEN